MFSGIFLSVLLCYEIWTSCSNLYILSMGEFEVRVVQHLQV